MKLFLFILLISFASCSQKEKIERENGWYFLFNGEKDGISKEPIITVKDFISLELDSTYYTVENEKIGVIYGEVSRFKRNKYADATEKAIGKQIGFIYNNEIIFSPRVNTRIESGLFQILIKKDHDLETIYYAIRQEKIDSIKALFTDWNVDSTYRKAQLDSLFFSIDYTEAVALNDLMSNPLDHHWYGNLDTATFTSLEKELMQELQNLNLSSNSEDYMHSVVYIQYKDYIHDYPEYINLMFQGFLFDVSPKGLYGILVDDIVKNKYSDAPSIMEFVENTDNRDDELLAIHDYQKRIWRLINCDLKSP